MSEVDPNIKYDLYFEEIEGHYKCLYCANTVNKFKSEIERHINKCHINHSVFHKNERIILCKKLCKSKRSHYHCSCGCDKIYDKKDRIKAHLDKILKPGNITKKSSGRSENDEPSVSSCENEEPSVNDNSNSNIDFEVANPGNKIKCTVADCKLILYKRNLKTHMERFHNQNSKKNIKSYVGSCIDKDHGIYLVSKNIRGLRTPVHVQKLTGVFKSSLFCGFKECEVQKTVQSISGNVSYECDHLLAVSNLTTCSQPVMNEAALDDLIVEKRIEVTTKDYCLRQFKLAKDFSKPLIAGMVRDDSDRFEYLSAWVPPNEKSYWCRLGRVLLTFDHEKFDLICACTESSRKGCQHKSIAKWFLKCKYPDLQILSHADSRYLGTVTSDTLKGAYSEIVTYQLQKKIPLVMPADYLVETFKTPLIIVPNETKCPQCLIDLQLKDPKCKAKLLTRFGYASIEKVWVKVCPVCDLEFHYSGFNEGFYCLNKTFYISNDLLKWIRNAILVHSAVGREMLTLERQYKIVINHELVRHSLYNFLALLDDDEYFRCYLCGYHPVILTFDVNRKCCFDMEGIPQEDISASEYVNAQEFWDGVSKEIIESSYTKRKKITPSTSYWAPFIGKKTRKEVVLSTEFLKGAVDDSEDKYLKCLSEESLENLVDTKVEVLKEMCEGCGINTKSKSRFQLQMSLKSALKSAADIDKFFFKVWHASGGLLTGTCPHGVVYAFKSLLKAESTRDYGDILLSMKHPPTVVISDVPHMLAAHVNKRSPDFFYPHAGRVVEPTEHNIKRVEDNNFPQVSCFWLENRNMKAPPADLLVTRLNNVHPVTLVHQRLSLYDNFHKHNTSQRKEFLRRTSLVKELDGVVTETAEQLNSVLKPSLYSLTKLDPLHHIMVLKTIFALRNKEINVSIVNECKSYDLITLGV